MAGFRAWFADRDFDMMHLKQVRAVIKQSRELLASTPVPDAFAGRKTHEPFPQEDEEHTARWTTSKELPPPKQCPPRG